jgi:hypothetical protein
MAPNTSPIFGLTPQTAADIIEPADTTTPFTVYTAGSEGGRLLAISAVTDDTTAVTVNIYITPSGGSAHRIGQVVVPIGAGTTTVPSVNLLTAAKLPFLQPDGSLLLEAGAAVSIAANATLTSAKTLWFVGIGIDY